MTAVLRAILSKRDLGTRTHNQYFKGSRHRKKPIRCHFIKVLYFGCPHALFEKQAGLA